MVTTNTDIGVASRGLILLGENPINDFEIPGNASTAGVIYPAIRQALFSAYDWSFAKAKRQLTKDAGATPLNVYTNAFALPADLLEGPDTVYGDGAAYATNDFELFGNHIYCDYDTVIIDYKKLVDEQYWPEWFVNLMAHEFARAMAIPVTESTERAAELRQIVYGHANLGGNGGLFAKAKQIDSKNRPVRSLFQNGDPLLATRY